MATPGTAPSQTLPVTAPTRTTTAATSRGRPTTDRVGDYPVRLLDREEVGLLVKRGEDFLAAGDIAAARLVLQRAAEARDARAALVLGSTYDPILLGRLSIRGIPPDIALARSWYERAKEFGSAEAPQRLEMLVSRDK